MEIKTVKSRRLNLALFLFISILSGCLSSCQTEQPQTVNTTPVTPAATASVVDKESLKKDLFSAIEGIWLAKEYADGIIATRSPERMYYKMPEMTELIISAESLKGDTLEIGVNISNHEGGNFYVHFPPLADGSFRISDPHSGLFEAGSSARISFEEKGKEKYLSLNIYDKSGSLVNRFTFIQESLERFVNEQLFSGEFFDNLGNNLKFSVDGKVEWNGEKFYFNIMTDLCCPKAYGDRFLLGDTSFLHYENSEVYGFKSRKDSLYIYATVPDETIDDFTVTDSVIMALKRRR